MSPEAYAYVDEFKAKVNLDSLLSIVTPIYAKHFTLDELNELIAFYKTPIG